eukprot:362616-Chlamydomonas_euryale.AAC.2
MGFEDGVHTMHLPPCLRVHVRHAVADLMPRQSVGTCRPLCKPANSALAKTPSFNLLLYNVRLGTTPWYV